MKNGIFLVMFACLAVSFHAGPVSAQAPVVQAGQLPTGQQNAAQQQPQMLPAPFQIGAKEQKYIDDVLGFWEYRSGKVFHYETKFRRWEFDSQFGPADAHKTFSEGLVKYEKPDKGLFKVESIRHWTAPQQPGGQASYEERPGEVMEHWVCDGKSIFEFDVANQKLKEYKLPPEQQGLAIANGPLPFLFGAKKQDILNRFYLREKTPPDVTDEYWLEAWPRFQADAQNYRFIEIIIDKEQFLPVAIQVYDRSYDPHSQPPNTSRTTYEFLDRKPYEQNALTQNLRQMFGRAFFEPSLPRGWQRVVENAPGGGPAPGQGNMNQQFQRNANRGQGGIPR